MAKKIVRRTRKQVYRHWVRALRSGKYKQTDFGLRDGGAFCCLGVLCDLAARDGGPEWSGGFYMNESAYLPETIASFIGLPRSAQFGLAEMNDNGKSFKQIARHIETNYMKD